MYQAWNRGITPHEFRECYVSDLQFISAVEDAKSKLQEQKERDNKIKKAMESMQYGGSR